ncbi:MAG: ParB/RepB/Spo0J family partition protein [Clostridiales bacterium]|nr:ParB/RepB/Spo0J family partition protein [Clostridiales bacterium]
MASRNKKGLGKGLGALFVENTDAKSEDDFDILAEFDDEISDEEKNNIRIIKIRDIEPNKNQPRKKFDKEKLEILSSSIEQHGMVQPILVKPNINGTYTIVAGERRWRAAKLAKLKEVPCIVRELSETEVMEIALIENLQREDLNPIEEAEGYKRLIENCDMTQEDVAKRIGKSRSAVANSLRLNNLCDDVKQLVIEGKLSQGHARTLLGISDNNQQLEVANMIIEKGLNVRQVETLVAGLNNKKQNQKKNTVSGMMKKYFAEVENSLGSKFGTKVKISEGANKGKIEIEYYSKDDLERILFELNK